MTLAVILQNPIVVSSFFAMCGAQLVKSALAWRANGRFHWRYLFVAAGMPSSHTATVTALSAAIYAADGPSNLFIASTVLSLIVVRDVIGDRAFAQEQENILNRIFDKITRGQFEAAKWNTLIGHTLKEVAAGFLLGLAVTAVVFRIL